MKVTFMSNYFTGNRICKYCGINIDIKDVDILFFFHGQCWQEYRKHGQVYQIPKYADKYKPKRFSYS